MPNPKKMKLKLKNYGGYDYDERDIDYTNGQRCYTKHCAQFANDLLRSYGYTPGGNAWEVDGTDMVYNGYKNVLKGKDKDAIKDNWKRHQIHHLAAQDFYKNFNSKELDPDTPYVVNLYYNGSGKTGEAWENDSDGVLSTHEGVLTRNPKDGRWYVHHNIGGTVHVEDFYALLKPGRKWGITAILKPGKNILTKAKWGIKRLFDWFKDGGKLLDKDNQSITINVNNKEYNVKLAVSSETKKKGLMGIKSLPKNEGMLFVEEEPLEVSFWMKDTLIPLDIIFIDKYLDVIKVEKGTPNSEEPMTAKNVKYVLELNLNSGIKKGDDITIQENDLDTEEGGKLPTMKVLDSKGKTLMELEGGERIVSRRETKILIKKAITVEESKGTDVYESKCKALGNYMFKVLDRLDNNEPEYVENKNV